MQSTSATQAWRQGLGVLVTAGILSLIAFITYRYYRNLYDLGWSGLRDIALHGLRQVLWMLALAAATIVAVASAVALQSLAARWRKVRVFISYKHDHLPLVATLSAALSNRWMAAEFVPFAPADHDRLIDSVRKHVRRADVVLVLPGSERSFVDAEVLAAATLRKIVVFLRVSNDQTTPDTAFTGYPVFELETPAKASYVPLVRFLLYVARSVRDVPRDFWRASAGFHRDLGAIAVGLFVAAAIINSIGELAGVVSPWWQLKVAVGLYWSITVLAAGIFATAYLRTVYRRIRAARVARQSVLTRTCTYALLSTSLAFLRGDREILESVSQAPLALRY